MLSWFSTGYFTTLGWEFYSEKSNNVCSKYVKRGIMNSAKTLFDSWYLYNRFLRNCGPLEIRLLQGYVILWIMDTFCETSNACEVWTSDTFHEWMNENKTEFCPFLSLFQPKRLLLIRFVGKFSMYSEEKSGKKKFPKLMKKVLFV